MQLAQLPTVFIEANIEGIRGDLLYVTKLINSLLQSSSFTAKQTTYFFAWFTFLNYCVAFFYNNYSSGETN
jgi:hypothetical protein